MNAVLKNINIGTRLALGFAVVLALLVAVSAIALWRLQAASVITEHLIDEKVRNERLISEWAQVIHVNAARTTAAWLATDVAEQKVLEDQMKASSARATVVQDTLVKLLQEPVAKDLLANVLKTRAAYTAARASVFKGKADGDMEGAKAIYASDMVNTRTAYLAALDKLAVS